MDDPLACLAGEDGVLCNGRGYCEGNMTCRCYEGWTGKSDLLSYDGYDCLVRMRRALAAGRLVDLGARGLARCPARCLSGVRSSGPARRYNFCSC
jgi:hypothetical protein